MGSSGSGFWHGLNNSLLGLRGESRLSGRELDSGTDAISETVKLRKMIPRVKFTKAAKPDKLWRLIVHRMMRLGILALIRVHLRNSRVRLASSDWLRPCALKTRGRPPLSLQHLNVWLDFGFVVDACESKSEKLQELTPVAGDVGLFNEIGGRYGRPDFAHGGLN